MAKSFSKTPLRKLASGSFNAKPLAPACNDFIREDGRYGKIGQRLVKDMSRKPYKSSFLNDESLHQLCPNFKNLKSTQKLQAWVWFWMVLANEEASCSPQVVHSTHAKVRGRWVRINPKEGYGLFAAEHYGGDRKWRGQMCRGDMKSVNVQISCAVHTMFDRHLAQGEPATTPASYWGPVRRLDQQITPNMELYSPCFAGTQLASR